MSLAGELATEDHQVMSFLGMCFGALPWPLEDYFIVFFYKQQRIQVTYINIYYKF